MIKPLTMDRFDGGITDNFLATDPNRYYVSDNFLINEAGKPYTRKGTSIFANRVPADLTYRAVTGLYYNARFPFNLGLFVVGQRAYVSSVFSEIPGYDGHSAIPGKGNELENTIFYRDQCLLCVDGTVTSGGVTSQNPVKPTRLYAPTGGTYQSVTLGLPALSSVPTASFTAGTGNYVYAFHLQYTLTDSEGTQFVERGPVKYLSVPLCDAPNANAVTLQNIPVLVNTTYTNYDVSNIQLRIHRTTDAGTAYYFVTAVTNGTTTYVDSMSDATLQASSVIYTDGGALDWTQPPTESFHITEVNDYIWYAGDDFITQSIQGAPGASPAQFQQFMAQKVKGLSSVIGYPILFCERSVYRIEGVYDEFGNGGFEPREISPSAGCVAPRSIVKVPGGLAWAGNGGFYYTDGAKVIRISESVPLRFKGWQNRKMTGTYDSDSNMVFWTACSDSARGPGEPVNDELAVWHLDFGVKPDSTFTTLSFNSNFAISSVFYNPSANNSVGRFYLGDARGYVLYFDPLRYCDKKLDDTVAISSFIDTTIRYNFISGGLTETPAARNYTTDVVLECGTSTDVAVQIMHRRDDTGAWVGTPEIRQDGAITWGLSDLTWGNPATDPPWNAFAILQGRRGVPAGQLRSQRRQVRFTNSLTTIFRSDDLGTATVTLTTPFPTITLTDATKIWPTSPGPEGYYLTFESAPESGLYTTPYLIKERLSDTQITVFDPYGTLTALVSQKWQITGYRKNERLEILSYSLFYEVEGNTQNPSTAPKGTNA